MVNLLRRNRRAMFNSATQFFGLDDETNRNVNVRIRQGATEAVISSAFLDAVDISNFRLGVTAVMYGFNTTNEDRWRNNTEATVLASALRSATTNSADQTNFNAKGLHVFFDITARTVGAAPSISVQIQSKDPVSGAYFTVFDSGGFDPTILTRLIQLYPSAVAGGTFASNNTVPRTWRIRITFVADVTNLTFSVGIGYVL